MKDVSEKEYDLDDDVEDDVEVTTPNIDIDDLLTTPNTILTFTKDDLLPQVGPQQEEQGRQRLEQEEQKRQRIEQERQRRERQINPLRWLRFGDVWKELSL